MSSGGNVYLGVPGEYTSTAPGEVDCYCTKVGGDIVLPSDLPEDRPDLREQPTCGKCKQPLALLFQAYTPLSHNSVGRDLLQRNLFLFTCPRGQCASDPTAWRALRLQREPEGSAAEGAASASGLGAGAPPSAAEVASAPMTSGYDAASEGADEAGSVGDAWGLGAAGGLDWGLGGGENTWGDLSGGDGPAEGIDLSEIGRALEEASAATRSTAAVTSAASASTAAAQPAHPSRSSALGAHCFPEFHVAAEAEPDMKKRKGKGGRAASADAEEEHIRCLIAQYEAEEGEISGGGGQPQMTASTGAGPSGRVESAAGTPTAGGRGAAAAPAPLADLEEDEALKATWQGEGYEEDSARGASSQYIKFKERLERQPQQVARYGFGMDLLWPDRETPAVSPCGRCGAARVVELQLVAPLAAALEEASEYLYRTEGTETVPVPDAWDWSTVAVWSCGASCGENRGSWSLAEEVCILSKE